MDSKADVRPPRLKPSALIYPLFWLAGHLGEICALKLSHSSDTWNPPLPRQGVGGSVTPFCLMMLVHP